MTEILGFKSFVTIGLVGMKSKSINASLKPDIPSIKANINLIGLPILTRRLIPPHKIVTKAFRKV